MIGRFYKNVNAICQVLLNRSEPRAKVVKSVENGTIVADVEVRQTLGEALNVLRRHPLEEFDVFLGVEMRHIVRRGHVRPEHLHPLVQAVVEDEAVRDRKPMRLHRVSRPIMEVSHFGVVKINDFLVARRHFYYAFDAIVVVERRSDAKSERLRLRMRD